MNWSKFNTHGESSEHAFEVMCNLLFERWCRREYGERIVYSTTVNGAGGDGGVEAYTVLDDNSIIAVQSKWFPDRVGSSQISQIKESINMAHMVRPEIVRYIVCIPRDLTSRKRVKNGKITDNTEERKWFNLKQDMLKEYPNTALELWNETKIFEQLQYPESQGSRLYWFENTEITETAIRTSYEKAVAGWASTEYVSDLYTPGYIHQQISSFIGCEEYNRKVIEKVQKVILSFRKLEDAYLNLRIWIRESDSKNLLASLIESDLAMVRDNIDYFEFILPIVESGERILVEDCKNKVRFSCTEEKLKESMLEHKSYFHFYAIKSILDRIADEVYECLESVGQNDENKLIFIGNPGTGKTFGIVAEIQNLFTEGIHIPILVHAREFSEGYSWRDILTKTLSLNSSWDEESLFQALESTAYTKQRTREIGQSDNNVKVRSNVVICVDGLDEITPYQYWEEKIKETKIYKDKYERTKFVFLTRPYAINCKYSSELYGAIRRIPHNGDADLDILFNLYLQHYKISVGDNLWIKGMLGSPLVLKLFCDVYRDKKITTIDGNSLVITELFRAKINLMDEEFSTIYHMPVKKTVFKILIVLSELFSVKHRVSIEQLKNSLVDVSDKIVEYVMEYLNQQGFIYSYEDKPDDILSLPDTYYMWGMQRALDYLIANQLLKMLNEGKQFPVYYNQGILQMLSLLLIEKNGSFLFQYKEKLKDIEDYELFELMCFSMAHTSPKIAANHKEYLKKLMAYSPDEFRAIVNRVVIPVSRVPAHPLGASLFDEYLRTIEKPAERDIWLSVPSNLRNAYDEEWSSSEAIVSDGYILRQDMEYTEYPLIDCWLLSSVDNEVRNKSRVRLTEWGISNTKEFIKLFNVGISINDPQVQDDLVAVAYGISLSYLVDDSYLKNLSDWIIENVFSEAGLEKYYDAAIRYYCRGIVDISLGKGVIEERFASICKPPYKKMRNTIPLAIGAVEAERMRGYGPIGYDLARYVLCDGISSDFFRKDYKSKEYFTKEALELLRAHQDYYGLKEISVDGFIIAAAYQYILECGWSKEKFSGTPGHRGIDSAIRGTYWAATHGSQSRVMSVAEKYVWCAKNKILAFLADSVPFYDYEKDFFRIDDYAELTDFLNPYQDLINESMEKENSIPCWIHTEKMAIPTQDGYTESGIRDWLINAPLPDFKEWIMENDKDALIYTFTEIGNYRNGISELIIVSTGLVKDGDFKDFIELIDLDRDARVGFMLNAENFQSGQSSRLYCTPQEACAIDSRREVYDELVLSDNKNEITVYKALSKCMTRHEIDEEKEFKIPGKKLRKVLGITYGDGYKFYDAEGNVVCTYTVRDEDPENFQYNILVNKKDLESGLEKNGYRMFWLFRVARRPSYIARERFQNIYDEAAHTFLVWFEDEKCRYKYLEDSDTNQEWNLPFNFQSDIFS